MSAKIRPLKAADRGQWDVLWQGYLTFYEHELSQEQTELTWRRLLDDKHGIHAIVAELDGKLVGLAHFSFTHSTWSTNPDLYLEDLFVSLTVRGQGIGTALILMLQEIGRLEGSRKVWWETHRDNATAQRLYDSVAQKSDFIKYVREID